MQVGPPITSTQDIIALVENVLATTTTSSTTSSVVQVRKLVKPREKSPCVSFDADVVYHVPEQGLAASAGAGGVMRARSRSDASSRFKGTIAWLRYQ